jgi:hypothetical protein
MIVYKNPQRQWLAGAEQELAQRLQERAIMDQKIQQLQKTIEALRSVVAQEQETTERSLPQLCLQVLSFSPGYQAVPVVRDGLRAIGVEVPGRNPLAVLHTTLSRLVVAGLAEGSRTTPVQYRITNAGLKVLRG